VASDPPDIVLTVHAARQLPETAWNEFAQWFQNGRRAVIVVKIERSLSRDRVSLSSNTREGGVVVSDSVWH